MSFRFHDLHPRIEGTAPAVLEGLGRSPKRLHPKLFYDEIGSRVFERICEQPEYYIPRVERSIVDTYRDEIVTAIGEGRTIIEPGAGSGRKVRFLLEAARPAMFVPMDISAAHLRESAARLALDFPDLPIHSNSRRREACWAGRVVQPWRAELDATRLTDRRRCDDWLAFPLKKARRARSVTVGGYEVSCPSAICGGAMMER
jgi:hypothetical protein